MIKYLGSKRLLIDEIAQAVSSLPGVRTATDLFSGTSRVGYRLKRAGLFVRANDHNAYAHTLALCHVAADADEVAVSAERLLAELSRAKPHAGWFTETYCERSRYFQPRNGERIEGIRERIAELDLDPVLESVALTSLMEAADRVDSTTGLQMAYLKAWSPRSFNDLELRVPAMAPGRGEAHALEAEEAAARLPADLVYVDPPYNQHSYLGNYHVWETLVRWDEPEVYGVACKRVDVRERKSAFNGARTIRSALERTIGAIQAPHIVVSFSDEGRISADDIEAMLAATGRAVSRRTFDNPRYVGAKIGIHNPKGERVGAVSHTRNSEHLFIASR